MSTVIANAVLRPADDKVMLRKSGCIMQNQQYEYSSVYEDLNNNNRIDMPGDLGNGNASITPYFGDSKILFTAMIHCGHQTTWRTNFFETFYRVNGGSWTQFYGGFGSNLYSNTNSMSQTVKCSYLLDPSYSAGDLVGFKLQHVGHANGGHLHLNQISLTSTTSNNNVISAHSKIYLQEVAQ